TNYTTNTNTQKSNQGQAPANNSANNTSRPDDKYSFESNNMAAGKVPTLNVWDKMSTYFKDVMKTPQNLTSYKAFEQAIKNNPEGYLQPGSNDMGKIKDVQKKLNYLGMNITVNGQFGSATETAIIRFKNSVGINDGYMTKSGKMAVTPIVTPQVWSLLNAQVSNKMNPNANVRGGSYVTPVTQQEKDWARQLAGKIQQFGYKPSEQERQRYENIYQRQQTNSAGASPTQQKQVAAPSAQEMNWAKQLAAKVQSGYKPTAHEKNTYQDIFNRNKTANNTGAAQQANNVPTGPSQQELAWATALMNKVKAGYKPNANEEAKYQQIYQKTQGQGAASVQNNPAPTGPSQQEMN
ncbi:peptidoglycan-binding protein, partial [bacterium]